jgi:hypothetical protein
VVVPFLSSGCLCLVAHDEFYRTPKLSGSCVGNPMRLWFIYATSLIFLTSIAMHPIWWPKGARLSHSPSTMTGNSQMFFNYWLSHFFFFPAVCALPIDMVLDTISELSHQLAYRYVRSHSTWLGSSVHEYPIWLSSAQPLRLPIESYYS